MQPVVSYGAEEEYYPIAVHYFTLFYSILCFDIVHHYALLYQRWLACCRIYIRCVYTKIRLRYYLTVTFLEVKLSSILQRKVLSYYPNKQIRVCCDTYKNANVIYFRDTLLVYNT